MSRHIQSTAVLNDGFRIAYQRWQSTNGAAEAGKRCLCLHGWMDNSNSFSFLAPFLAERGCTVVAIDHLGHGHSSHTANSQLNQFSKYVYHVKEMLKELQWETATLIGHSMGAGIATMFAGVYPESVERLVLIEGLGPVSQEHSSAAESLRKALDGESRFHDKEMSVTGGRLYGSLHEATLARVATVKTFPGNQSLSEQAALSLVTRGSFPSTLSDADSGPDVFRDPLEGEAVRFRHDPKLNLRSYTYNSHEQVHSYLQGITAQTLLISGENGMSIPSPAELEVRMKILSDKGLLHHKVCPGSHHLHLDPDHAPGVAQLITTFLEE